MKTDLIRRDPFGMDSLRQTVDRLFDDSFFRSPLLGRHDDEGPLALDIAEQDGKLVVRASLPGFTKEEIDVQVKDGILSIKAEHSEEAEHKTERYYRRERHFGALSRRVALPGMVSDSNVDAELKDGVLTLTIDAPAAEQTRKIEIRG